MRRCDAEEVRRQRAKGGFERPTVLAGWVMRAEVGLAGGTMAQVQIRCPNSGLWASVGLEVDDQEWHQMPVSDELSTCGVCGETHRWSKHEARLVSWSSARRA